MSPCRRPQHPALVRWMLHSVVAAAAARCLAAWCCSRSCSPEAVRRRAQVVLLLLLPWMHHSRAWARSGFGRTMRSSSRSMRRAVGLLLLLERRVGLLAAAPSPDLKGSECCYSSGRHWVCGHAVAPCVCPSQRALRAAWLRAMLGAARLLGWRWRGRRSGAHARRCAAYGSFRSPHSSVQSDDGSREPVSRQVRTSALSLFQGSIREAGSTRYRLCAQQSTPVCLQLRRQPRRLGVVCGVKTRKGNKICMFVGCF